MTEQAVALRLVVLNPNTSLTVTAALDRRARRCSRAGTEVVTLCPSRGPRAVECWTDAYRSVIGMLDRIATYHDRFDALIMAGFGDVGFEALRESVDVPVIDITHAGAAAAAAVGGPYAIATTVAGMVEPIGASLRSIGLAGRCIGIEPIGAGIAESTDAEAVLPRLTDTCKLLAADGAASICLGSAAFSPYAELLRGTLDVPVIDPLEAAIALAEGTLGGAVRSESTPPPEAEAPATAE